jgi:FAD synthase
MTVLSWPDLLSHAPPLDGPVALTIGVFDGLHVGHRRLIGGIRDAGALPLVLTFRESPQLVRSPDRFPGLILTWTQRVERLASMGVAAVVAIDFSRELSNLSGKAFIGQLTENLTIQRIVVGQNFRFGKNRASGTDDLKEMLSGTGVDVHVMEPVVWGGAVVSSSRIRAAVQHADFLGAAAMLASDHCLDLRSADARERTPRGARYARAGLRQVLPREGAYDVTCTGPDDGEFPGRLTVGPDAVTIEAAGRSDIATVRFRHTVERSTTHVPHEGSQGRGGEDVRSQ